MEELTDCQQCRYCLAWYVPTWLEGFCSELCAWNAYRLMEAI